MKKTWCKKLSIRAMALLMAAFLLVAMLPFDAAAESVGNSRRVHPITIGNCIANVLKAIGGLYYATEQDNGNGFFKNWFLYTSGNTDLEDLKNEVSDLADLTKCMETQYDTIQEMMTEIGSEVASLRDDIRRLSEQLAQQQGYEALKAALNDFYTNFFSSSYTGLLDAYHGLKDTLSDPYANDVTIKAKMDDLYMKAYKMSSIEDYLTGKNQIDGTSILDLYLEYVQKSGMENVSDTAFEFTQKMFAAAVFQKYCMSYASAYQLNYVNVQLDELINSGEFIGYTVDGTLDGFVNKYTVSEIKTHIITAKTGVDSISIAVIKNLVNIYKLDKSVGYTEEGCQYYADVVDGEVSVYPNASYQLMAVSDELAEMFDLKLYFVGEETTAATWTATGCIDVHRNVGESFAVSYVYGDGTVQNENVIYEIRFTVSDRKLSGGYGTSSAPYLIGSKDELKTFASNDVYWKSGVNVKLLTDVSMLGDSLNTIGDYYGVFDGDGHIINDLSGSYGWFTRNHGVIKNLKFFNLRVSVSGTGSGTSGGIVDENYGTIRNCSIISSSVYAYGHNYIGSGSAYTTLSRLVGGIAGANYGNIILCNVVSSDVTSEVSSREIYQIGGVFENDVTSHLYSYCGGIAASSDGGEISGCYVKNSNIKATVYAGYYKWKFWWEHTYNKVVAECRYGLIAGKENGTIYDSNTYNGSSSSADISAIAYKSTDNSFVTSTKVRGFDGSSTSNTTAPTYLSEISVYMLPQKTTYLKDEMFNCAGLRIINNHNEEVYGFTVSTPSTSSVGEKIVRVQVGDLSVEFTIIVGCAHKTIRYDAEQRPTCKDVGYTEGVYCLDCNTYTSGHSIIPKDDSAHVWSAAETVVKPTCNEKGMEKRTCLICGKGKNVDIDPVGHEMKEWTQYAAATCTEKGENRRYCKNCDYYEMREIAALAHDLVQHSQKEPSCKDIGWDAYETCLRCNYTTYHEKAASGHDMGEWIQIKASTCEIEGEEKRFCKNCDYAESRKNAALGHSYDEKWSSDSESHWHECSTCGNKEEESAHKWDDGTIIRPATISEHGEKRFTCCKCGHTRVEPIEKLTSADTNNDAEATAPSDASNGEIASTPNDANNDKDGAHPTEKNDAGNADSSTNKEDNITSSGSHSQGRTETKSQIVLIVVLCVIILVLLVIILKKSK